MDEAGDRAAPGWIDISVPIRDGMVHWPGDPPVRIERVSDVERGDSHSLSKITMGSHTGTHIDAPAHFIKGGAGVSRMPLDATVGRARVIEISDAESIKLAEVARHDISQGERILFKTRNSALWQSEKFSEDYIFMADETADYLAGLGVKAVGVDYLSVGAFKSGGGHVHRALLGAGVWIIEGLDLSQVSSGNYYLICLPLRLEQGDGSPARALIRPL